MEIIKRTGKQEAYQPQKIRRAMELAFQSTGNPLEEASGDRLLRIVEEKIQFRAQAGALISVEEIQDLVEQTLMEENHYRQLKRYILYREDRANKRRSRWRIMEMLPEIVELDAVLTGIQKEFPEDAYELEQLRAKFQTFIKPDLSPENRLELLTKAAVELTTQEAPRWENIAARLLMLSFERELAETLRRNQITSFYEKLAYLPEQGLYGG